MWVDDKPRGVTLQEVREVALEMLDKLRRGPVIGAIVLDEKDKEKKEKAQAEYEAFYTKHFNRTTKGMCLYAAQFLPKGEQAFIEEAIEQWTRANKNKLKVSI